MPAIRRPPNVKPEQPVRVNLGHPMAQGIEAFFYYPTNRGFWDAVSGRFMDVATGTPARVATAEGAAQTMPSADSTLTPRNPGGGISENATIICRYRMRALPSDKSNVFSYIRWSPFRGIVIGATSTDAHAWGAAGSNGYVFGGGTGTGELNKFRTIGVEHGVGGDGSLFSWVDGVAQGVSFVSGATNGSVLNTIEIGGNGGGYVQYPDVEILWAAAFNRRLTDAEHAWWHRNAFDVLESAADIPLFIAAGGGATVTVGLASETDVAQAISRAKRKAVGLASETDAAQAIGRVKRLAIGLAIESDVAQAVTARKAKTIGLASETDAAQAVARKKAKAVGLAAETDAAQAIAAKKAKAIGLAAETDAAQAITGVAGHAVSLATESDTAQAIGHAKRKAVGLAAETDAAQVIAAAKGRTLSPAAETDTAIALGHVKRRSLGLAIESDIALDIGRLKRKAITAATETDEALAITAPVPTIAPAGRTLRVGGGYTLRVGADARTVRPTA